MLTQDTTFRAITKDDFLSAVNDKTSDVSLREAVRGKLKIIAERLDQDHQKVRDALRGNIRDPFFLGALFREIKIMYNERLKEYTKG